MIPRSDFHCITRWVAHSVKIGNAFAYFVVSLLTSKYKYLNKVFFDCKINNINEQDESFFTVSQAHDKNLTKLESRTFSYLQNSEISTAELISIRVISLWFLISS